MEDTLGLNAIEFDFPTLPPADSLQDLSKLQHGAKCDVWTGEGGEWFMKFKKGSRILVPKAFKFSRHVAGQTPGWEAGQYGIPDDIASQVDRATLRALVCTAEVLNMSGITDPYEFYKYMHPSEKLVRVWEAAWVV